MLLKKVQLHGFKSFADKTEIAFEPGITAVVGPNGSGKSNIGDALRWVLGEGSAKALRGSKMEDVIFAGSDKRRGVGLAEVVLTLDNSEGILPIDFSEVSVTRRVFRSGESEFLINGSPCRLKDIHELFMDSGLGRDAYSLLSQTDVDAVLSVRPEERRRLLDEAAGITKFKTKKNEALRRLDETQQGLVRLADIISELEKQIEPLSRQAKKARRYQQLAGELREKEVGLLAAGLQEAVARWESDQESLSRAEAAATEVQFGISANETRAEELRLALTSALGRREETAQRILETSTELEKLEGRIQVAEEKLRRWDEETTQLTADKANRAAETLAAEELVKTAEAALAAKRAEAGSSERQVVEQESGLEEFAKSLSDLERDTESRKAELIEALNEAAQLRNSYQNLAAEREARTRQLERLRLIEKDMLTDFEAVATRRDDISARITGIRDELRNCDTESADNQHAVADAAAEVTRIENLVRAKEAEHSRVASRLAALTDLAQSHEGYFEGVRAVMSGKAAGQLDGILAPFADLLKVAKAHELAFEIALGGGAQDVVVETEAAAKRAVALLKERRAGRATFLPLETLRTTVISAEDLERTRGIDGFLGCAVDLAKYQPKIRKAVEYLLGRTLVCTDLDAATAVARACNHRFTIVTLGGDLVRPGGAITGGQVTERSRGLLSRPREIEELQGTLTDFEHALREMQRSLEAARATQTERREAGERLAERRRRLELDLVSATKDEEAVSVECDRIASLRSGNAGEIEELVRDLADEGAPNRASQALQQCEDRRTNLEREIAEAQVEIRRRVAARDQLSAGVTTIKVALATLLQEERGLAAEVERLRTGVEVARSAEVDLRRRNQEIVEKANEARREADEGVAARDKLVQLRVRLEAEQTAISAERDRLTADVETLQDALRVDRALFTDRQAEVHKFEIAVARLEMEIETLANRLNAEYGLAKEAALEVEAEVMDRVAVAGEVEELRRKVQALGTVNVEAVDEYEQVRERYDFLSQQQVDLVTARDGLLRAIAEIERTTERRFEETFTAVQREFAELFTSIFGGGRAEITLTDSENLSETGIEIYAQPPGKKPQSLLLLSTGERTLTAIALLLAILRVKPSPFCLLDEVDAALDEANLSRFVTLLEVFSERTQFIVITHRRLTMEAAKMLYGVTQEERGVSKMISVRLEEAG